MSVDEEDMLDRFFELRPPRESALRVTGLIDPVVGEVMARPLLCAGRPAEPGVLRGPSLGVLRAETRGVEHSSPPTDSMR